MDDTPLITITTDFGTADGYVGAMKGVILGIVPDAEIVDITHKIVPQDVHQAAYVLYSVFSFFPPNAVHLVVVDPGVGSSRRPIALRTVAGCFVGPDNGVFSYVMACDPVDTLAELVDPRYRLPQVSHTFHGRDVFAPAAAHLAAGVPIRTLGPPIDDPVTFPPPRLEVVSDRITGEVLHIDHFGNVITNIGLLAWDEQVLVFESAFLGTRGKSPKERSDDSLVDGERHARPSFRAGEAVVTVADQEIAGVHRSYAEVGQGQMVVLVGSSGLLEVAVREGNAARKLGVRRGDSVVLAPGSRRGSDKIQ